MTDSTVVVACPPKSPPQNTLGSLVHIVSESTSGKPQLVNFSGSIAFTTARREGGRKGRREGEEGGERGEGRKENFKPTSTQRLLAG